MSKMKNYFNVDDGIVMLGSSLPTGSRPVEENEICVMTSMCTKTPMKGSEEAKKQLDESVIIIDDDDEDSDKDVRRKFNETVIIDDSDDEDAGINRPCAALAPTPFGIYATSPLTSRDSLYKSRQPVITNIQTIQPNGPSTRTIAAKVAENRANASNHMPASTNSTSTSAAKSGSRLQTTANGSRGQVVDLTSHSDMCDVAQRVIKFAPKKKALTITLRSSKGFSCITQPNKQSSTRMVKKHGAKQEKDSYRHFLGVSNNSKNWPKKMKDKKKAAVKRLSEENLNKVVLGIRNISSEHNAGANVTAFTSGKSPARTGSVSSCQTPPNIVTKNKQSAMSTEGDRHKSNSASDGDVLNVWGPSDNAFINKPANCIFKKPNVPEVIDITSASDRRIAFVSPSSQTGMQITLERHNTSSSSKRKPVQSKPPLSPRTLLHLNNGSPAVNPLTFLVPLVQKPVTTPNLRPIAIDGSNVAFSHGKQKYFSCRGIKLCIEFFKKRGHQVVKAFVPQFRRRKSPIVKNQDILEEMSHGDQEIVFTPSRNVNNCVISSYDDRFIVEYAVASGAVMVSNDCYRDLMLESLAFKAAIAKRLLMYTFVDDLFMVPQDPLGRNGPSLDTFLSFAVD